MKKILSFLFILLSSPQAFSEQYEVSLFSGYRSGGDLENASTGNKIKFDESNTHGFIFGMDYGPEHVMEFLYSNQNTDLYDASTLPATNLVKVDIEYFQFGGSQIWSDEKIDKFFGGTLGTIRLDPSDSSLSSSSHFAMSLGGGLVFKITPVIGLRFEARAYFSSMGDSSTFCGSNNQCVVVGNGFMKQYDINAGLRFRF